MPEAPFPQPPVPPASFFAQNAPPQVLPPVVEPAAEPLIGYVPPAVGTTSADRNARQLRREQLRLFPPVPVTDVTVVIGITDPAGERREIHHQVAAGGGQFRIVDCQHGIKEEMAVVKEDGAIIGHEPTGKYRLKLDVTFVKE